MNFLDPRLPARFWSKCIPEPNSGCWLWIAAADHHGYGVIGRGGRGDGNAKSYRMAYETLVGRIPPGLHLDHLCRTPACCNPAHLEPVTPRENYIRGIGPALLQARHDAGDHPRVWPAECPTGHPYDQQNTYVTPRGHRRCRECHRIESRRRHRAAAQ